MKQATSTTRPMTTTERQRAYRARRRAESCERIDRWLHPDAARAARAVIAVLDRQMRDEELRRQLADLEGLRDWFAARAGRLQAAMDAASTTDRRELQERLQEIEEQRQALQRRIHVTRDALAAQDALTE
jgi:hypothetical protein